MSQLLEKDSLTELACQVIETTAFAFAQAAGPSEAKLPEIGVLCAQIVFQGSVQGSLRLAAAYEAATTIAGNLLGLDSDDVDEVQAMQGIHELLNIIAGQWLTYKYGVKAVFKLGIPQNCDALANSTNAIDLVVDDFPMRLELCVA